MTLRRWNAVLTLLAALALVACGDDPDDADAGSSSTDAGFDAGEVDDAGGGGTDAGGERADAATGPDGGTGADGGAPDASLPPGDFTEAETGPNDPYLGTPEASGLDIGDGFTRWTFDGTVATDQANEAWADSDGYAFSVSARTRVRAELDHRGGGALRGVAILRADHQPVAWWAMSAREPAFTTSVELEPGDYVLHVSAALPAPSGPEPYQVAIVASDARCEAASRAADHAELEVPGARSNDAASLGLFTFPEIATASGSPEATGLTVPVGEARVLEGTLGAVTADGDSYLDRDVFAFTSDADEVEVFVQSAADDVDVDVIVLRETSSEPGELAATGMELGHRAAHATAPTSRGATYRVWVAARDETRFPGGSASLPMAYRVTVCGR